MIIPALVGLGVALLICWHDLWLEASDYSFRDSGSVTVRVGSGVPFAKSEPVSSEARFASRMTIDAAGVRMTTAPTRIEGDYRCYDVDIMSASSVVALTTHPRTIELSAGSFRDYVNHDVDPAIWQRRDAAGLTSGSVQERYRKFAKLLVRVGDSDEAWSIPTGLTLEIVPVAPGSDDQRFSAAVLFEGAPVAGARVGLFTHGRAGRIDRYTDAGGVVQFRLEPGVHCLRYTHMKPANEPGLDYESWWASLVFKI